MNNITPYQKKFLILLGGFLLLIILSYQFSIKRTFAEKTVYKKLKSKTEKIANLDYDLRNLSNLNTALDNKLGGESTFKGFQENLLHEVGQFCHNNKLIFSEFSEPFKGIDGGYWVETIILKVQGKYKPLLKLVHHLENSFGGGKLASTQFIKEKNFKTNKEELFLKLYVQKINKKDDEKE